MISEARKAQALTGMLLLVVVGALTGQSAAIQIHQECIDDINNEGGNLLLSDGMDLDGGPNGDVFKIGRPGGVDPECIIYPWADGNGESHTPIQDRYNGDRYQSTTFEVWEEYLGSGCMPLELWGIEPPNDGSATQAEQQCSSGGFVGGDPGGKEGGGPPPK